MEYKQPELKSDVELANAELLCNNCTCSCS